MTFSYAKHVVSYNNRELNEIAVWAIYNTAISSLYNRGMPICTCDLSHTHTNMTTITGGSTVVLKAVNIVCNDERHNKNQVCK